MLLLRESPLLLVSVRCMLSCAIALKRFFMTKEQTSRNRPSIKIISDPGLTRFFDSRIPGCRAQLCTGSCSNKRGPRRQSRKTFQSYCTVNRPLSKQSSTHLIYSTVKICRSKRQINVRTATPPNCLHPRAHRAVRHRRATAPSMVLSQGAHSPAFGVEGNIVGGNCDTGSTVQTAPKGLRGEVWVGRPGG
jgi:hypothetical protein